MDDNNREMTNAILLDEKIKEAGFTKKQFAARLGLSYAGYQAKIRRQADFKTSEIYLTRDVLKLSSEDVIRVFFGEETAGERCSSLRAMSHAGETDSLQGSE